MINKRDTIQEQIEKQAALIARLAAASGGVGRGGLSTTVEDEFRGGPTAHSAMGDEIRGRPMGGLAPAADKTRAVQSAGSNRALS